MSGRMEEYTISRLYEEIKFAKIYIPADIQREIVWNEKQKTDLIDSIKRKFFIGSILVYRLSASESPNKSVGVLALIDGLQRTHSIVNYLNDTTGNFTFTDSDIEMLQDALEILSVNHDQAEEIKTSILKWINEDLNDFEETAQGFTAFNFVSKIKEAYPPAKTLLSSDTILDTKVNHKIQDLVAKVRKEAVITDRTVQVYVWEGKASEIPAQYERLNANGTQLNKYQIYRATWSQILIPTQTQEILDLIQQNFKIAKDAGYLIGSVVKNQDSAPSLSQYLTALGQYLYQLKGHEFNYLIKNTWTDHIAYNMVTFMCDLKTSEMDELPDIFMARYKNKIDELEKAIIYCLDFVFNALKHILLFRGNRGIGTPSINHSENLLLSMVCTVFRQRYDHNLRVKTANWKVAAPKLEKNLPMYYLFDQLEAGSWKGGVEQKAYNIIQENQNLSYLNEIGREKWEARLNNWFHKQLDKLESKRRYEATSILFLKYIYVHILTVADDRKVIFHVDHIYSVSSVNNSVEKLQEHGFDVTGLPLNCVANLAFMEKKLNRDKSDKSIRQFFNSEIEKAKK